MKKIPNVRIRSNGTYEKRITINGERPSIYGKTLKELETKEFELRKAIESGLNINKQNITLDKYYEEWLERKRKYVKQNSIRSYIRCYTNHVSPTLGNKKIQKIERRDIIALQNDLEKNNSINCSNYALMLLNMIFNEAIRDDIIIKNPASKIKRLSTSSVKATNTYHRALTIEEQTQFMDALKDNYYYEFFALLLVTGMRFGEAAALMWKDIDYVNNVVHITRTLTQDEKGTVIMGTTPKSNSGKRDIPITNTIKKLLYSWKEKNISITRLDDLLFTSVNGTFLSNHYANDIIRQTLKKLETKGVFIESFTLHALRATYATRYIEQNSNAQVLKALLGHSNISMTLDLYAHVLPEPKQKEANKIAFNI